MRGDFKVLKKLKNKAKAGTEFEIIKETEALREKKERSNTGKH